MCTRTQRQKHQSLANREESIYAYSLVPGPNNVAQSQVGSLAQFLAGDNNDTFDLNKPVEPIDYKIKFFCEVNGLINYLRNL